MENQQIEGQVRHVLTLIAGFLAAFGFVDNELVDGALEIIMQVVVVALSVVAFVRSWITKEVKA